jgi:hypothetical protein
MIATCPMLLDILPWSLQAAMLTILLLLIGRPHGLTWATTLY